MAKLERLLNLTAALLATERPLTAEELRARVPGYPEDLASFRRAFERDKESLRAMGLPLQAEPIPGRMPPVEGYRARPEEAFLRDPGLEPDELAALHWASSVVRLEGVEGGEAFWKLGGVTPPTGDGTGPNDTGPDASGADGADGATVAPLPSDPHLVKLFAGVAARRTVRFSYRGEPRRVNPYRLDLQRGRWYLTGFDHLRVEERVYRLDRIEGAVTLEDVEGVFERPEEAVPGLRLEAWQLGEEEPVMAEVLVDADQAPSAVAQVGDDAVTERLGDGSVRLALRVTNRAGFRNFVLGLLDHAEVVAPEELRADLVTWLRDLAATG